MFFLRLPQNFKPEAYGWIREDQPSSGFTRPTGARRGLRWVKRLRARVARRRDPGFGVWVRVRPGFQEKGRESLVVCAFDEDTGAYGGWFYPIPLPESETMGKLWARLKDDPGAQGERPG